ncbi:MAG: hypothetical protein RIQ53_3074 [Pseudomonadota bacterium]
MHPTPVTAFAHTGAHGLADAAAPATPPTDMDALLDQVARRHAALSPQLQRIARHVERHRSTLALERIQDVAVACGVQPSAVVRFAQCFGLRGFHALKRLAVPGALATARAAAAAGAGGAIRATPGADVPGAEGLPLADWPSEARSALDRQRQGLVRQLARDLPPELAPAARLLLQARRVWIAGEGPGAAVARRLACGWSGGVSTGPAPALRLLDPPLATAMDRDDLCLLVHLAPHDGPLPGLAAQARRMGAPVIVLTDSRLPRLGQQADVRLLVEPWPALVGPMAGPMAGAGSGVRPALADGSALPALWLAEALLICCAHLARREGLLGGPSPHDAPEVA